jgi:hypothetical protein
LSTALLEFKTREDLTRWLAKHAPVDPVRNA